MSNAANIKNNEVMEIVMGWLEANPKIWESQVKELCEAARSDHPRSWRKVATCWVNTFVYGEVFKNTTSAALALHRLSRLQIDWNEVARALMKKLGY